MHKKLITLATAGAIALGSVGVGAALVAPTAAAATATAATERVEAITTALADLVSGGTITQEQADAVADTLATSDALRGGGHHGGRLLDTEAAATALGMSEDELRTALEADGATLTTVAEAQGVEVSALTEALTAAATERIEQRVTDGDLTREEADEKLAALPDRVAELLTREIGDRPERGDDAGPAAEEAPAGADADA